MDQERYSGAPEIVLLDGTRLQGGFGLDFRWVTERLALGGMIGLPENVEALRRVGITHVMNLQEEFDDTPLLAGSGISLYWLGVPDTLSPFPEEVVRDAIKLANPIFAEEGARLFVHCMAGRNRSPIFAYAILRAAGWMVGAARTAIRRAEPAARLRADHLDAVERCLACTRSATAPAQAGREIS